ncbi:hypothetical protein BH10ACI3_BH10ACI3_17590 [soil metagenome]
MARSLQLCFADAEGQQRRGRSVIKPFAALAKLTIFLIFANSTSLFAQTDSIYRLPAGTRMTLKMDTEVNSRVFSVNDTFLAKLAKPVTVRGTDVLPVGTHVEGRITGVKRAGSAGRNGRLDLVFETIKFENATRRIDGVMAKELTIERSHKFTFLSIFGGTAAGAGAGAATGSGSGTLIGAGIGAGFGTAVALFRRGKDVRLRKDEEFEIVLKKDVILPVLDY